MERHTLGADNSLPILVPALELRLRLYHAAVAERLTLVLEAD
jgi:hypothetical protein